MIIRPIKLILLILISSHLISCQAQTKPEARQTPVSIPIAIGNSVSNLYQQIWEVYQDSKGNFWFGSNGEGVYIYDGKTLKQYTSRDGLVHNQIRGIQEDDRGNLYIETPAGVSKFDGTKFTTLEVVKSPQSEWKNETKDLWFNCNGNHLYRFDGKVLHELFLPMQDLSLLNVGLNQYTQDLSYSPYSVFGVDRDQDGNVWIGTVEAGAFRYDGDSFVWIGEQELSTLPDGRVPGVRSMLQDKDGYMWLSNFNSKYKINKDSEKGYEKVKAVDLPKDQVKDKILYFNSGLRDQEGNLWMTTYGGGVWKYDGYELTNTEINNGTENVLLISIFQDRDGIIWLGTNNDGVYKQNGKSFEKFVPDVGK